MKLKQLLASALLFCSIGATAQTDVTSTYLTNAGFDDCTAETSDVAAKTIKNYSSNGWTNASTGSFTTIAVTAYGGGKKVANSTTPGTKKDGETVSGNTLGIIAGWSDGVKVQSGNITLPAGAYTITVDHYLSSGTNNYSTSYFGFVTDSKEYIVSSTTFTASTWTTETVSFTLAEETTGKIQIGLKGTNTTGSGAPAVFYDDVKIEFTAVVVKDVLQTALTAANTANAALGTLTDAIATAQAVYENASATQDDVNTAAAALNVAVELAMSAAGDASFLIPNLGFESCTVTTTNAAAGGSAAPMNIAGDWTQVSSASWSSSAVVEYGGAGQVNGASAPSADNLSNGGYTLGVSVGWGGTVTYKSAAATFPAGVYTVRVNAYNALSGVTQFKSMFGFVPTSGSATLSTKTSFTYGEWETDQVTFTLNEATEGYIQVGGQAISGGSGSNAKVFFDNITIGYQSFLAGAKAAYDEALDAANEVRLSGDYVAVVGAERIALDDLVNADEPTTIEGYNDAADALNDATATFTAAKSSYDALVAEIAYAKSIGISEDKANGFAAQSEEEFTAATAVTNAQDLKELEYSAMGASYANDVTSLLGTWTAGNYDTTSGQGYISNESYFDKWNGSAMDLTSSATVKLPAGQYIIRAAGRGVSSTTMNLSVKVGEADAVSTPFFMNGDTGKGIDTDGVTNFSEEGTYSNNNIGRGWQYRYVTFTVAEGGEDVTIAINGHLNAGTWQSFYAPMLFCDDATYAPIALEAAKAELQAAIDAAPAVREANIGDDAFQIAEAGVTAYSDALAAAAAAKVNAAATVSSINEAKTALAAAIETYNALEINAPADGKLFNIILTFGGWDYNNKAVTYLAGDRTDMGGYNIKYQAEANTNLAQAFTFTKVSGNNYKMSQIDGEGNMRYVSTGTPHGGNAYQIRTTTDADQALVVTVIPTATEGVWNLYNTEAGHYIGSQDAGFFTVDSHIDFNIVETTKPSIAINTTGAGWGTVMLPFAQALPEDVNAYSVSELDGDKLTLVEVDALEANKPYIIEGAWNATVEGNALGTTLNYTDGLLTGVYAATDAPVGTYVLQKHEDKVGFYQVESVQPTVGANRAYLTAPAASEVKAFFLGDTATAIQSVFNGVAAGEVYDLSGRKVAKMQRGGAYIINGQKVIVK